MNELNNRTCAECKKIFRTPGQEQLCPSCREKHRKASLKQLSAQVKSAKIVEDEKPKPKVSIAEEQHIERVYNAIHKSRYYGYSEIVGIIENRKGNTCVCCGEELPEGRMVCPSCERKAEDERRGNIVDSY